MVAVTGGGRWSPCRATPGWHWWLGVLWFPFDWLSTVWPAFGTPFRQVFRTAHDHFVGHTLFFLIVGALVLACIPSLRRRPQWYFPCLVLVALIQETIQAIFRAEVPTFSDLNAFTGDALGGSAAFVLWIAVALFSRVRATHLAAAATTAPANDDLQPGPRSRHTPC